MKDITTDTALIAKCGLYCGACKRYLKEKCPGCEGNEKASWCKVRTCCIEHEYKSCADCELETVLMDCKKYNNVMAKIFGFIFRSNRAAGIQMIKDNGYDGFAKHMAENRIQAIRR